MTALTNPLDAILSSFHENTLVRANFISIVSPSLSFSVKLRYPDFTRKFGLNFLAILAHFYHSLLIVDHSVVCQTDKGYQGHVTPY